jgi:hypothetical protein
MAHSSMKFLFITETQQRINLVIVVAVLSALAGFGPTSARRRWWTRFCLGIPVAVAFVTVLYFVDPYIDLAKNKYGSLITSVTGRALIGVFVILFGCSAHLFKMKNKLRYGQCEMLFGAVSAASIAGGLTTQDTLSQWVGLAGSAYVVARGLNNWSEALNEKWMKNKDGFRNVKQHVLSWFFLREKEMNRPQMD